ncbi:MAG: sacsin N-terminal ATP-binding-like domain-containing protein [Roseateles sp.]|uniref:sacsin N-terminal ATP-binding-like domain-containing protein n=1 Tax=Roseateles sp. TaxID=1971397 RepID=UPI0040363F77
MSLIQQIAKNRQLLLDGIEANGGDINLGIFEDFYPDEAHFIFELLQNAEDAGATEVAFELSPHGCAFEHNGSRHFNERDIRGITGIFNSSKKGNPDQIGKFGVGFKSVFVYTDTPVVYSKQYSFRIERLVLPVEVPCKPGLGDRTRFEFPFNNVKKNVKEAFAEVKSGLEQLSENTLLFLRNLGYIKWKVGAQEGALLREEHSENHVEVLKQLDGRDVLSSHWLRFSSPVKPDKAFEAPVDGVVRQHVAIAFELTLTGDRKAFDSSVALRDQLRVVPAERGKVSVFFPADKETSGLRFHLHGPFVPELSRASIKNSPENVPLFGQLGALAARSLHAIKKLGLLSGDFLGVLPNNEDSLPERYKIIRTSILDEMKSASLVPTHRGGHAPATRLVQAKASLKVLLNRGDLAFVTSRQDSPDWAIGATQKNSNQDRFLASLGIPLWETDALIEFLESRARKSTSTWDPCDLDQKVLEWIAAKSFEWLQALYAHLFKYCQEEGDFGRLDDVYFIPLASGKWGTGSMAYFQTGPWSESDRRHRVDERVLKDGSRKSQQQDARRFLEQIGVREPNELDEISLLLTSRYKDASRAPTEDEYQVDLPRMMAFLEGNPHSKGMFAGAKVFKVAALSASWAEAGRVFLDEPFGRTGLRYLYELTTDQKLKRWPLDGWYLQCGIPLDRIIKFAEALGCQTEFDRLADTASCYANPNWGSILSKAPGERAGNMINRDFALASEAALLLKAKALPAVQLVWKALCRSESARPSVLQAVFQFTDRGGPRSSPSQLVCKLREIEWVPQTDGTFVKPRSAAARLLPKGLTVDAGYKWLEAVEFGAEEKRKSAESEVRAEHRRELGFESEEQLARALEFKSLPKDEQERMLAEAKRRHLDPIELPERPVSNPDRRRERVSEDVLATPDKSVAVRERTVQIGVNEAKAEAKVYLRDQYTNGNGQMICQACKDELPFRLPTGAYYFEAVELVDGQPKRYRAAYLALCPNHAAAFQYANSQRNSMRELLATAASTEVEVTLGGRKTTIYFTQTHLADARASLSVEDD